MSPRLRLPARTPRILATALVLSLALVACDKDKPQAAAPPPVQTAPKPAPPPPALKDIIEHDARYIVGISFPPEAKQYPGLAAALQAYADGARAELLKAVQGADPAKQTSPYDLTLSFSLLLETPDVVAVAADGSSFTGGAHGDPLVARFVWLPKQQKMLTANELFADPNAWTSLSDYAREQLHATLSQRVDADELSPGERADVMRSVGRMIDEGTEPAAATFAAFEPIAAPAPDSGRLMGLRFVFPPYQVGPYVDGVRTVEVPTAVLMPYLSPALRPMFVDVKPAPAPVPTDATAAPQVTPQATP